MVRTYDATHITLVAESAKKEKETGLLHPLGEVPVERPEPEPTPGEEPVNPPDQHPDEPGETTPTRTRSSPTTAPEALWDPCR